MLEYPQRIVSEEKRPYRPARHKQLEDERSPLSLRLGMTNDILQDYISSIDMPRISEDDEIGIISSAIFYMQQDVGFHHLNCVPGKVDTEVAVKGRVIQNEARVMLNLLVIGCTRSKRLFWRRPTPEHLKRLEEISGEEARWFEDFFTKEEFDIELLN